MKNRTQSLTRSIIPASIKFCPSLIETKNDIERTSTVPPIHLQSPKFNCIDHTRLREVHPLTD